MVFILIFLTHHFNFSNAINNLYKAAFPKMATFSAETCSLAANQTGETLTEIHNVLPAQSLQTHRAGRFYCTKHTDSYTRDSHLIQHQLVYFSQFREQSYQMNETCSYCNV